MPRGRRMQRCSPTPPGIDSPDYVWNKVQGEELLALRAKGNAQDSAVAYTVCKGCHGAGAPGDEAGYYPRLAGQHATVLIKQLADVRSGQRDNPKMYPFANEHVITPQEMADIAVYLQGLPSPPQHGAGPGTNLARGETLYRQNCVDCHGAHGEGNATEFYPRLQGQHYRYLLRQATDIRDGVRRNAHPDMVNSISDFSGEDLQALIDYISHRKPKDAG